MLCANHRDLDLFSAEGHQSIEHEQDQRSQEEIVEDRRLNETPQAVQDHQDVEHRVEVVRVPEGVEDVPPGIGRCEHVHHRQQHQ